MEGFSVRLESEGVGVKDLKDGGRPCAIATGEEIRKRVCVFGGSFDPPTCCHLHLATSVVCAGLADEVWLVPAGDNRVDKVTRTPAAHRLEMTKIAVEKELKQSQREQKKATESTWIQVKDVEIAHGSFLPTFFLLEHLKRLHPFTEFSFLVGSDLVSTISKWCCASRRIAGQA
eukprot:GHVT01092983.1.p2 GENE.GHVT01092983.1~~GHVT01092983.1.p2  ORF type:complete len:174 (+),score=40.02 GHVT01092983.1:351-872(+)